MLVESDAFESALLEKKHREMDLNRQSLCLCYLCFLLFNMPRYRV